MFCPSRRKRRERERKREGIIERRKQSDLVFRKFRFVNFRPETDDSILIYPSIHILSINVIVVDAPSRINSFEILKSINS